VLGGAQQKGRLVVNDRDELAGFTTEEHTTKGWINGGMYAIAKAQVLSWPEKRKYDLEKEILPDTSSRRVNVLKSEGNLLDIGIPACYSLFDKELGPLEQLFSRVNGSLTS
jgi:NDP-sugar pyrophosphorylase family protein